MTKRQAFRNIPPSEHIPDNEAETEMSTGNTSQYIDTLTELGLTVHEIAELIGQTPEDVARHLKVIMTTDAVGAPRALPSPKPESLSADARELRSMAFIKAAAQDLPSLPTAMQRATYEMLMQSQPASMRYAGELVVIATLIARAHT